MSIATAISFATAALGFVIAGVAYGLSAAPGRRELRWFAALALTGGLYGAADVLTSLGAPDAWVTWGSQFSLFVGGLHCCAWLCYMAAQRNRRLLPIERVFAIVILVFAGLALVPGALVSSRVEHHVVDWLGIHYDDAIPSALGAVCFAVYCVSFTLPIVRYGRAVWAREAGAGWHVVGVSALFVGAVNDAFVGGGLWNVPYLLSPAFLILVGATAFGTVRRIVEGGRQLDLLTKNLECMVAERTAELARAQRDLLQAEKLAALGQLAAGLAHEISNPAFAVVTNLDYLREHADATQELPPDARECLDESRAAMDRIVRVVRRLLDATGATVRPSTAGDPTRLAGSLDAAVREARKVVPDEITIAVDAPEDLVVAVPRAAFEQIVGALVINAGQAIGAVRASGRIGVEARRGDGRAVVTVRDDGPGIPEAVRARIFEPFFTTKDVGQGAGLGLAVARGLARSLGGDLRLAETSPAGTVMVVELPAEK